MKARNRQAYQEKVYQIYIGEILRNVSENIARIVPDEGATYISKSYIEVLKNLKEPSKSSDEIIDNIKQKLKEYE